MFCIVCDNEKKFCRRDDIFLFYNRSKKKERFFPDLLMDNLLFLREIIVMALLWGREYRKADLLQRVGHISQIAEIRPFELSDGNERGCRGVLMTNGSGLSVTVLTDRGMSLTDVSFDGIPLAFKTPMGSVHPSFFSNKGLDWLRTWPGGFCTPCGLTYLGAPCIDEGKELGLHGRVAGIPARQVSFGGQWIDDSVYELSVEGSVREAALFAENVVLTRRIITRLGEPRFVIEDRFENEGYEAAPHMFLQHVNLGFPLIDDGAILLLPPCKTTPRDADAEAGIDSCRRFCVPEKDFREQVFYHQLKGDAYGMVTVGVVNRSFDKGTGLGIAFTYNRNEYPNLVEWKMMKEGAYVVGVEPANCLVEGRGKERKRGALRFLEPGEARNYRLEISVLRGTALAEFADSFNP